jgi:hypothetical protein
MVTPPLPSFSLFSTLLYLPSKQRIQGLREDYKGGVS